jgi:outer membrane protein TolC
MTVVILRIFIFFAAVVPVVVPAQAILTLAEAERLALEQAPALARSQAEVSASRERTVYAGALPDPQLTLGALNVPIDSYRLDQEDMTVLMLGVRQALPPGDTRRLRTQRAEQDVVRDQARLETERRAVRKQVRLTWLELHFAEQSLQLLEKSRALARRDVATAEARYRAAQETPRALLRARQAVARLNEREPMLRAQVRRLRSELSRFIGAAAVQPLPDDLPALPAVPDMFDPTNHPQWLAAQAERQAMQAEARMAREEYKPGVMLDLQYGRREDSPTGMARPDLVTAMMTFDLPVFRSKRQDRRLAEKQLQETAAGLEVEDKRREIVAMYEAARAEHEATADRVHIVSQELLPAIRRETKITIAGFAREQTELREARMRELEAELELLRLRVDLAKSQADLLYLTGEQTP